MGKGALQRCLSRSRCQKAPCPPAGVRNWMVGTIRFVHPTTANTVRVELMTAPFLGSSFRGIRESE